MSSTKKRGGRRLRVALASAIAALGVSAVGVSSASAVTATFDHGSLKLPAASFEIITPDDPVLLANFPADGAYDITPGNVTFPTFSGEALPGVDVSVTLVPQENLTGTYDAASGAMTGDASDWKANLIITTDAGSNPCDIGPFPMALTTANNAVFQGDLFDAASSPPVNGSISSAWTGLPAGVGAACSLVDALTSGAGGIWLSNGVAKPTLTPPPEEPPVEEPPPGKKKNKCKKAKKKKGKAAAAKKKKCKKKKKKK